MGDDTSASGPRGTAPAGERSGVIDVVRNLLLPAGRTGLGTQLVSQSAKTTMLNLGSMVFTFVTTLVLSRMLGARGYGTYVYALALPTLLALAAQLGYGHLLVRNVAAYSADHQWGLLRGIIHRSQRLMLTASLLFGAGAGGVGWMFVGQEQPWLRQAFFIALLLVPALALIAHREAVLRGFGRVALGRLPETTVQPLLLLVLVGVLEVVLSRRVSAPQVMAATVAAAAGALAVGTVLVARATPPQVNVALVEVDRASWSRSARSLLAINGLQVVNLQMGVILLGAIESVDATAVFSVALRLAAMVSFLQTAVTFPLAPAVARLHAAGSRAQIQRLASRASLGVLVLSTPIVIGLLVFGEHVLALFGEQFRAGTTALTILVIGELVNIASGFVVILLIGTGQERTLFTAAACVTAAKLVASASLVSAFGLEGAALGQALGIAGQNVVLAILVWRRLAIYSPGLGNRRFLRRVADAQIDRGTGAERRPPRVT